MTGSTPCAEARTLSVSMRSHPDVSARGRISAAGGPRTARDRLGNVDRRERTNQAPHAEGCKLASETTTGSCRSWRGACGSRAIGFSRGTEAHVAPQDLYAGDGIRELARPIASHDHAAPVEHAVILPPAPTRRMVLPVNDVVTGGFQQRYRLSSHQAVYGGGGGIHGGTIDQADFGIHDDYRNGFARLRRLRNGRQSKSISGNTSLAVALLAFPVNLDSGPRWVWRNRIATPHTFRALALRWIDDGFFHLRP